MWPPTTTPCECPQAGWCERHHCLKHPALFLLCRRQTEYYQAWEEGRGPCLPAPGTELPAVEATECDAEPAASTDAANGPGLLQRAWNLGKAVTRHVADGGKQVDDSTFEARLAICRECPSCDTARMVCRDPNCGCFLNIKARWQSENCPQLKWPAIPIPDPLTPQ